MAKLDLGARMTIKTLSEKKLSNCRIAGMLGVTEGAVRYQLRRMASEVDDGRAEQTQLASAYADAIAYYREQHEKTGVSLVQLHEWLVENFDYPGSRRSVHRYWTRTYPEAKFWARRRVETPPGAQGQADWAHHSPVVIDGRPRRLYSFHLILSHSRRPAIIWSPTKKQIAWQNCHLEAFKHVGGVPATVRVDNEKTAVIRGAGAWGTINAAYRRFAELLRFHIDPCPPRHPASKGKVERLVRTYRMRANPLTMAWDSLEELQAWTDEQIELGCRKRRCPATGTSIHEAWLCEQPLLTPLPDPVWQPFDVALTRRVGIDGLVAFEGRQYHVPFTFVRQHVEVRGCAATVQIFAGGRIVAEYERGTPERILINPAFYEGDSTAHVKAPPPLGRMGKKILELADEPVTYRSIDFYHALAEVAR